MNNFKKYDPIEASSKDLNELVLLCDNNEIKVAKNSLNAKLSHWKNGDQVNCRDWITELVKDVTPLAEQLDMFDLLKPIESVLINGNQAMRWLDLYAKGTSIESVLKQSISEMELEESNFMRIKRTD